MFDVAKWDLIMKPKFVSLLNFTCWIGEVLLLIKAVLIYIIDDGFTAINNANDLKLDRIRKESITLFTEEE